MSRGCSVGVPWVSRGCPVDAPWVSRGGPVPWDDPRRRKRRPGAPKKGGPGHQKKEVPGTSCIFFLHVFFCSLDPYAGHLRLLGQRCRKKNLEKNTGSARHLFFWCPGPPFSGARALLFLVPGASFSGPVAPPRDTHGAPTGHPRSTHRTPTGHPRSTHGTPTEHPRDTHGRERML